MPVLHTVMTVSYTHLQIDCEMSFVQQDDVIELFEGMAKYLFKELRGVESVSYTHLIKKRGRIQIESRLFL